MHRLRALVLVILLTLLAGCGAGTAPPYEPPDPITDPAYLTADLWNDGQAEVAFYQVERTPRVASREEAESFLAGTYLVKHNFDPVAMAKAADEAEQRVPSFKYALFYEFERGSYQYKRSYVVNAVQQDLTPLKASLAVFDWCSNLYRELAFHADGAVAHLMRSDDYGNAAGRFDYRPGAYPAHLLPLLIRGLDFEAAQEQAFSLVGEDGTYVGASARLDGTETLEDPTGAAEAERIVVTYDQPVLSLIGEETDASETYWRGTGPDRLLIKLESETGRYRMTLVEHLRTPYWEENLWPRLQRVMTRP